MAIRALIFDLGGVLIQRVDRGRRSFWEGRLGVDGIEIARQLWLSPIGRKAMIGQASEEEVWVELGRHFSLAPEELNILEKDFKDESSLDVDLLDFIRALHHHYKTGVISDAFLTARSRLQQVIPAETFDTMVISAEEGVAKPDPVIYRRALDRLGVAPSEAIFVDDIPHNVAGAQAVGLHAIQFHDTAQVRQEISNALAGRETGGPSHV
jgi:HAD superfamily hydrolase (TIGR01509 family)